MLLKLKTIRIAAVLLLLAFIAGVYAEKSTFIDNNGWVHESMAMPISIVLGGLGMLFLLAECVIHYRNRKKQSA